jgi:hypothetical protein
MTKDWATAAHDKHHAEQDKLAREWNEDDAIAEIDWAWLECLLSRMSDIEVPHKTLCALLDAIRNQDCLEVGSVFMDAVREEIAKEKP